MKLTELQRHWNEWGKVDPLWAILSAPDKRDNKWEIGEFFEQGKREIGLAMSMVRAENFSLRTGRALDFGCGVGRLTQALCDYFDECYGVDIASSMIEQAERYNRFGTKCHYVVNEVDDLRIFEDGFFDFVYTNIVLQHMRPEFSTKYIQEFVRVLAPGGLLIFQIPSHPVEVDTGLEPTAVALPDAAFLAEITAANKHLNTAPSELHTLDVRVRNISNIAWPHIVTKSGLFELKLGNHWCDAAGKLLVLDDQRQPLPGGLAPQEQLVLQLAVRAPNQPGHYRLVFDLVQEGVTWFEHKGTHTEIVLVTVAGEGGESAGASMMAAPAAAPEVPAAAPEVPAAAAAATATAAGAKGAAPAEAPAALPDAPRAVPATSGPELAIPVVAERASSGDDTPVFVPKIEMYGVLQATVLEVLERAGGRPIRVIRDFSATQAWESYRYLVTRD